MSKPMLILLIALTVARSHATTFGPGVFEQLQNGAGTTVEGKITEINILSDNVVIGYAPKGHFSAAQSIQLCNDFDTSQANRDNSRSEEQRAAFFRERLVDIREAKKNKEIVQLVTKGPWNPCLLGVR